MTVFSEIRSIIRFHKLGSCNAAVYLQHLHWADEKWRSDASVSSIASDCDMTEENVRKAEAKLEEIGLIAKQAGGKRVLICDSPRASNLKRFCSSCRRTLSNFTSKEEM